MVTLHKLTRGASRVGLITLLAVMTLASSQVLVATAAAATAKDKPFKSAPALSSETSPETKPEVPAGDFRNPPSAAGPSLDEPPKSNFDITKATPVEAETSATQKVYENTDGSHTAMVSQGPARFQAEDGSWVDFDLTLVPSADGSLSAKAAPAAATFAAKADGGLATVQTAAGPIVLHHPDAGAVVARTEADHATYAKALGDKRDLVLSPTPDGYKEQVVLADASAGESYIENFELPPGMEVRDGGAGVEFVDAEGTVVATLAGGVAYDAAFPGSGASTGVSVHVVPTVIPQAPAIPTAPSPTTTLPDTTLPDTTLPDAGAPTTTIPSTSTTTVVAGSAEPGPTEVADVAVPGINLVSVEVSISKDWLAAKERKAPITIDPTVFTANAASNFDTYVATASPATVLGTSPYIVAGSPDGLHANRGLFYIDISSIPIGAGVEVVSADLSLYNMHSPNCTQRSLNVWGLSTPPTITDQVTWNTQPPLDAVTGGTTSAPFAKGATGCGGGRVSLDATRLARRWITEAAPNYGIGILAPNETDASNYRVFYSGQSGTAVAPILTITYNRRPTVATPVAPVNGTVLVNDSPSLQVNAATDPDVNLNGQPDVVQYWFRIGTGPNVEGGHGIDSGWFTPGAPGAPACPAGTPAGRVCWSVPPGALSEGVYFWHVFTWDGVTEGSFTVPPNDVNTGKHFLSIKLRLGADGSAPTDTIGPVQVNLASGNATLNHASPRFPTQGGDVGVNVAYNSSARSNGLVGEYYPGTAFPSPSTTPAVTRTDPSVAFYWGTDTAPGPGLAVDGYLARWTGNITVPAAGSYTFYAATTDGVKVYFNNSSTPAIDTWALAETSNNRVVTASPMTLAAGAKLPVKVEYRDQTGGASVTLGALAPTGPSGATQNLILPPSWFSAPAAGPVPTGWTLSAPTLSYTSARIFEHGATLTDPAGGLHTYAWTGSGYTPPSDEDGVLARDADGRLSLAATDGMTYAFDAGGNLSSATSALDDVDQASPKYTWLSFPRDGDAAKPSISRLEAISDPVAGRQMTLRYAGFNPALPCPTMTDPNLGATPSGKLCQVDNWDGTYTRLWYNPNGQLAKVVEDPTPALGNPLAAVTDYGYDTLTGKLNKTRDPLANDAVAVPAISATHVLDDDTSRTLIAYTAGRVSHVTLPVPYNGTTGAQPPRPGRGYEYTSAIETRVQVDFPDTSLKPNGYNRKVTFDLAGRVSTDFNATANTGAKATNFFWDEGDRLTAQLGPADSDALRRRSTAIYDGDATRVQRTGRVSDTYGPAPSSCFGGDGRANGSCTIPPPHTSTEFDRVDGVLATGLAVSAWGNNKLQGPPKSRAQAAPDANGVLVAAGLDAGVSSVRYTGEINLATVGSYGFSLTAAGSARLFVDDTVVADASAGGTAAGSVTIAPTTPPTTGWHRFRIDFAAVAGTTPHLEVAWTPNASSRALLAADLGPRFANPTKTTSDDSHGVPARVMATTYESLSEGVVKHDIVDPGTTGQLNLVTTSGTEAPGAGQFRRPTSRTLPANVSSNIADAPDPKKSTLYAYYSAFIPGPPPVAAQTNTAVAACGVPAGVNQAGRVRTTTAPSPDGSDNGRRVNEVVYDAAGRVVASRIGTDAWTCTGYDVRGRIISLSIPAFGGPAPLSVEPARTFSYSYAVATSPLQATITEGSGVITTKVDLLGRVLSYSDIWAKTTTSTYDQAGRLTSTNGPAGAMTMGYDAAGRTTRQTLDGGDVALTTYNGAGELTTVTYPGLLAGGNGTALASIERHPTGAVTRLQWTGPGSTALADDLVTRSQSGKVVDQTIDGTDADPANANFTYDAAGRLTHAAVPAHSLDYAFAGTGGCGTQTTAGRNANRTSLVDNGGAPTTYCYNLADQLSSSSDTSVGPVTYDSHGNTATIGNQTLLYDGGDRHMATMVGGAEVVRYLRDPTGRITSRTEGASIVHYGSAGPTDSSAFTMDASNTTVIERTISLVGGVLLTKRGGVLPINDVWGYPNIHGDIVATANYLGVKQAAFAYDPFGKGAAPDNSAGNFDYGWLGQHQRPLEHAGSLATIEMGARQYMPSIGRFLEVDPVEGGLPTNDYAYVADPLNQFDLTGKGLLGIECDICGDAVDVVAKVARNPVVQAVTTVAACSTGVLCHTAVIGFTALNAYDRHQREGGFTATFFVGTTIDVGLAFLPLRNVRNVRTSRRVAGIGTPLLRANRGAVSAYAQEKALRLNLAYGVTSVARSWYIPW